ncbi:MAG: polysaccharide biosynthesis protein [Actinobacteria bacterium]|nr:MAG: polysaccharide biosynthesis protein [Actinomycetota bacterium]
MRARIESSVALRRAVQAFIDACMVALAYSMAYVLRFDPSMPHRYQVLLAESIAFVVVGKLLIFALFGLYHKLWRFVDQQDFETILKAVVAASVLLVAVFFVIPPRVAKDPPRGVIALDLLLTLGLVGGVRFLVRAVLERPFRGGLGRRGDHEVLIVGAGNGGQLVAAELRRNPDLGVPIGFVDDDPRKQGMRVGGLKVEGTTEALPRILDGAEPDEVVIAIPSAPGVVRQKAVAACRERGIPVRTLPTVFELLSGGVELTRQLREVQVEDVLGREPVRVEIDRVGAYLSDEVVLVTGAGGSIGAELCRQISRVGPKRLVLIDNAENSLFEIRRELEHDRHFPRALAVLGDCKDAVRMEEVFHEYRPGVVFHAAAYKHVPLMEENPVEAVRNNAVATRIVAAAAGNAGAKRFVLVSTDKAVSPATVMGASKALAEWALEAAQHRFPQTAFTTVRFGNVLGSSGSVVPIFRRQIAAGGPVTVTDPAMTRYFMTIPEAVHGGEVYVLEMGDPVRIVDLARNMIRLAGLEPESDVAIEMVGRRPGEKIHEELFNPDERPQPTPAEKIMVAIRTPVEAHWVEEAFARVEELVYAGDARGLASTVTALAEERALLIAPMGDAAATHAPDRTL